MKGQKLYFHIIPFTLLCHESGNIKFYSIPQQCSGADSRKTKHWESAVKTPYKSTTALRTSTCTTHAQLALCSYSLWVRTRTGSFLSDTVGQEVAAPGQAVGRHEVLLKTEADFLLTLFPVCLTYFLSGDGEDRGGDEESAAAIPRRPGPGKPGGLPPKEGEGGVRGKGCYDWSSLVT